MNNIDEMMDQELVEFTSFIMNEKLLKSRMKGRGGWWDSSRCSIESLEDLFKEHLVKGDMIDIIILAAMIQYRKDNVNR